MNIAEYRLTLLGHWSSCTQCRRGNPCISLADIPVPESLLEDASANLGSTDISAIYMNEFRGLQSDDCESLDSEEYSLQSGSGPNSIIADLIPADSKVEFATEVKAEFPGTRCSNSTLGLSYTIPTLVKILTDEDIIRNE